jgi:hypothetical protein
MKEYYGFGPWIFSLYVLFLDAYNRLWNLLLRKTGHLQAYRGKHVFLLSVIFWRARVHVSAIPLLMSPILYFWEMSGIKT